MLYDPKFEILEEEHEGLEYNKLMNKNDFDLFFEAIYAKLNIDKNSKIF